MSAAAPAAAKLAHNWPERVRYYAGVPLAVGLAALVWSLDIPAGLTP